VIGLKSYRFNFGGGFIPLNKKQKNQIQLRILGYNLLSLCFILLGFSMLIVCLIVLFFRVGPREQYYFPVLLVGFLGLSCSSKTIAIKIYECTPIEDPLILSWYQEVAENTNLFGFIKLKGIFKPPLYRAKMGCPNAFASGLNFLGIAQLPVIGTVVVLSDELIVLLNSKNQLQAVMAHELGHITSFDVGISSALALLGSIFKLFARTGWFFRLVIGFEILLLLPIILVWLLLRSTLSQLRELVADLKSVQSTNDCEGLINAFSRIAEHDRFPAGDRLLGDLFLSHPKMKDRTLRLREIGKISEK
jgi:Zn-dependent protease with chaperone function